MSISEADIDSPTTVKVTVTVLPSALTVKVSFCPLETGFRMNPSRSALYSTHPSFPLMVTVAPARTSSKLYSAPATISRV
jgi:hypothetical protein